MHNTYSIVQLYVYKGSLVREAWRKSLGGAEGLSRQRLFLRGLLLDRVMLRETSRCGEARPSGSGEGSLSNREEQSGSPEPIDDTLMRSEFRSCRMKDKN